MAVISAMAYNVNKIMQNNKTSNYAACC